jgi:hypothetical protein
MYNETMFRPKPFVYLVDGLDEAKAAQLKRNLEMVADIKRVAVDVGRSTVETLAYRNVEDNVKVACDVAKVRYRTRLQV